MNTTVSTDTVARIFFALGLLMFGAQYQIYGAFMPGLPPIPPWLPGNANVAEALGFALVLGGIWILSGRRIQTPALVVGIAFVFCAAALHGSHLRQIVTDGSERTSAFEVLALGGGALIFARVRAGRYLYGASMLVFAVGHFQYAAFVATLIPAWIPAHLFFAYFTGVAFLAAGIAIITSLWVRPASLLLALMFFSWFVLLHAPRVLAAPRAGDEWTSAFIALALSGAALAVRNPGLQQEYSREIYGLRTT